MRGPVSDAVEQGSQPVLIGFGKIPQHKPRHSILMAGVPYSKPYTRILCPEMRLDGAQAIVASMTPALFQAHFSGGEIQFIVKYCDLVQRNFVKPCCFTHRLA